MDLPVIPTPIFPRWVWMEEVTFSHIPIAAIITAWMTLAPFLEWYGYKKRDLRYDRYSKSLVYFAMILFSPGAALGTGIVFFIIGLYPEFWSRWSNIFFWPLIAQFVFFLLEVLFLFNFYYMNWDKMMHRKRLHIMFGFIAASFAIIIQLVWDGIGSYLLTPGNVQFPEVNQPVGFSLQAYLNPSFLALFWHRTFGNLSFTMLLAGGVFALRNMRHKVPSEKAYYGFAANISYTLGFLFYLPQPFIGWYYSRVLQDNAPVAFHAVMGGFAWYYFWPKMILMVLFVFIGATYAFVKHREKLLLLGLITAGFASFYILFLLHPPLRVFGTPTNWRIIFTLAMVGFIAYLWFVRSKGDRFSLKGWQTYLFVGGLMATLVFALGGNIRERSRSPMTVYGQLEKPEATSYERDRFVTYTNCIECHHMSERDLKLPAGEDWAQRVSIERNRPGVQLSDQEAAQIVSYLEEASK